MVNKYAFTAVTWALLAGTSHAQPADVMEQLREQQEMQQNVLNARAAGADNVRISPENAVQSQLPMPPMPDGVEPPPPPQRKPLPAPSKQGSQSAYKRKVLQELEVHKTYQPGYEFGELPELNARMPAFRSSTAVAPVQDMSLLSLDELERYIKQLDLNTYAGALTVDEHYAADEFVTSLPGMTRQIQEQILRGPSVDPEVPPEFAVQPRRSDSQNEDAIFEDQFGQALPDEGLKDPTEMASLRSPQYGAPRSRYTEEGIPDALLQTPEEFILDVTPDVTAGSDFDPQTAELLNRITAGSLDEEPEPIVIEMGEAVEIERGGTANPFDITVTEQYEDGVLQEPLLETSLDMEDMPEQLAPAEIMSSAYDAYAVGQYESAVMFYRKLLEENPDNIEALFGLATAYQQSGQFEQAKAHYIELLNREQSHLPALNNFLILLGETHPEAAIRQLKRLAKSNPEYAAIPAQLASLYIEQGDYQNAAKYMSRAAILEPRDLRYRYYLAILMTELGYKETASKLYQQMLTMHRQHGVALPVEMAVLTEEMGKLSSIRR